MTSYEFELAAKNAVIKFIKEHYDEDYTVHELHFVSFSHILGNKKCTLIDCGENARYYEVTYDLRNDYMYLDAYDKAWAVKIPGKELDYTPHE